MTLPNGLTVATNTSGRPKRVLTRDEVRMIPDYMRKTNYQSKPDYKRDGWYSGDKSSE